MYPQQLHFASASSSRAAVADQHASGRTRNSSYAHVSSKQQRNHSLNMQDKQLLAQFQTQAAQQLKVVHQLTSRMPLQLHSQKQNAVKTSNPQRMVMMVAPCAPITNSVHHFTAGGIQDSHGLASSQQSAQNTLYRTVASYNDYKARVANPAGVPLQYYH